MKTPLANVCMQIFVWIYVVIVMILQSFLAYSFLSSWCMHVCVLSCFSHVQLFVTIWTQFSSVAQSCLTLCNPMDYSLSGSPVHHQLLESTQTHVHWVSDAIYHLILCRPFSCLQSFPASGSFPMSQLFAACGQSIGVSASASVLPMNIQDWFPLGGTGWISLQSKGLSRVFSNTTVQKHQFFGFHFHQFFIVQLSHPYMTTGKTIALTRRTFVGKVTSLLFNKLSRWVITPFLLRSKCLLISWWQSPSVVIVEPPKIKPATVFTVSPSICHEVVGLDAKILVFWMLTLKPTFSLSPFTFVEFL